MKIRNFKELATTPAREAALKVAEAGLQAVDTAAALNGSLKLDGGSLSVFGTHFALSPGGKLIAVLVGKCAADAAAAFEAALGDRIDGGIAMGVGPYDGAGRPALKRIIYRAGTHPMPSEDNVMGTRAILNSLAGLTVSDTVLFLISGGGSTLLVQPPCVAERASELVDKEKGLLAALFAAGATIQEINTVRKHMSLARGGFLAQAAHPAQAISVIFSDVPGDDIGFVASGPTVKDATTVKDAETVMKKYGLPLDQECLTETPKDGEYFERVHNILALSNATAVAGMKAEAERLGYAVTVKNGCLTGEAREVGAEIAREAGAAPAGTVLLYCGETTVTVRDGGGRGGRNQEAALGALSEIAEGCVVLSLASDGRDNGDHAGALADAGISNAAKMKSLDPASFLAKNDSSEFFEKLGDGLIETGLTGSNVSDLMIAVAGKPEKEK
ncbi:MAG: DUF4147 domain-containing protein [Patescibacteria group bacterium]|nr:DUF4147 domain-containing protein [Patescibacteria group bacterium]